VHRRAVRLVQADFGETARDQQVVRIVGEQTGKARGLLAWVVAVGVGARDLGAAWKLGEPHAAVGRQASAARALYAGERGERDVEARVLEQRAQPLHDRGIAFALEAQDHGQRAVVEQRIETPRLVVGDHLAHELEKLEVDVFRIEVVLERVAAVFGDSAREGLEAVEPAIAVEIDLELHFDTIGRKSIGLCNLTVEAE